MPSLLPYPMKPRTCELTLTFGVQNSMEAKTSIRIVKDWQQGPCKSKESKEVALANKKMEDLNERKLTQLNTNFRSWFAINQTKDWQ